MRYPRETYMTALFGLVAAVANFQTTGRRVVLPRAMSDAAKPALFLVDADETYAYTAQAQKVTLRADAWIYTASGLDPNVTPAAELNAILDALDAAVAPTGADLPLNRLTLGGLVEHCRIAGRVLKDAGDVTGLGLAIVPIEMLIPQ
jgi:hypothetical protein